jgi:hypothetical protein
VNGEEINLLRFDNDIAIEAGSEHDLQDLLNTIEKVFQECNMKINKKKSMVLACGREKTVTDVPLKGERLGQVESFTNLGSTITWDGRRLSDIKRRIVQAKTAFMAKRPLLCSKRIRLETRKEYVKIFICTVALYGLEAWTIGKTDYKRIEAFKKWCWRRVLKIEWREKVRNEEVFRRIGEERTLWSTIRQRRTKWVGHLMRHNNYVRSIMEGKIEGKAPKEAQETKMFLYSFLPERIQLFPFQFSHQPSISPPI